jgi:hypothetical protein
MTIRIITAKQNMGPIAVHNHVVGSESFVWLCIPKILSIDFGLVGPSKNMGSHVATWTVSSRPFRINRVCETLQLSWMGHSCTAPASQGSAFSSSWLCPAPSWREARGFNVDVGSAEPTDRSEEKKMKMKLIRDPENTNMVAENRIDPC